jgi:asparagine synthase (glutamine-hydrolysing)
MCGIVGFCEADPARRVDEKLLARATRALAHRGPDGEGFLVRGPVGLGHRRLSIIDLAGGGQPLFHPNGRLGVVFNGEIYDYREIRADLLAAGCPLRTVSDTEVIVHAYEREGPACLQRFTGMFAFAVWDGRDGSVFVARDRLGKKPLFYHERAGRLAFASELKALLEDGSIAREIDPQALEDYLAYSYVPGERSILRGIRKLPPGHWMRWRAGRLEVQPFWDVRVEEGPPAREEEWAARVEERLRRAVRLRLRADVPVGVFLSGGLDSSAVTALASQEHGGVVKTFSVGFKEAGHDERPFARLTAARYATDHHEILVEDDDVEVLRDIAWHLDEPFADPSALPTYYVCREAARHVKVCLAGDGADEIFAGYSRYRIARDLHRRLDWMPAALRQALGAPALALMPEALWGRGAVERFAASGAERYRLQVSPFGDSARRALLPGAAAAPAGARWAPFFAANHRDLVSLLQWVDQKTYLPDDILVKVDRMSMQSSLEVRAPFLDHHLVELANTLPAGLKLRGSVGKYILRRVLAPHLPAEVLGRRKMGFGLPIARWFRGRLESYARDWLLGPESRVAARFERPRLERVLRQHAAGMRDLSGRIWVLLMLEHWCRRYAVTPPPAIPARASNVA